MKGRTPQLGPPKSYRSASPLQLSYSTLLFKPYLRPPLLGVARPALGVARRLAPPGVAQRLASPGVARRLASPGVVRRLVASSGVARRLASLGAPGVARRARRLLASPGVARRARRRSARPALPGAPGVGRRAWRLVSPGVGWRARRRSARPALPGAWQCRALPGAARRDRFYDEIPATLVFFVLMEMRIYKIPQLPRPSSFP